MWYNKAFFYQIYPLGLCGAPAQNDGETVSRLKTLHGWITHIKSLGANAVYFSPLFSSDSHGYDTRDYGRIDCRLGTNEDMAELCKELHQNGIRIVLDGVFNHVGRGFWAFCDLLKNREHSRYRDWFHVSFDGNSCYNDGFWYEGWEGHYELVKLNLKNPEVVAHLLNAVEGWIREFDIDGLRLDVAYCIDPDFIAELRRFTTALKSDFFLLGEMIHGDYNRLVNDTMLHSCTNYACYKGLYSSCNSGNMFEIAHSLGNQFGSQQWCTYRGKRLLNFVDNHDVSRIATILNNPEQLGALYCLLFTMPGLPCVYYGSEWGIEGDKASGDAALRPAIEHPNSNELTETIKKLAALRASTSALLLGDYNNLYIRDRQLVFERSIPEQRVAVAINIGSEPHRVTGLSGQAKSLLTGERTDLAELTLPPLGFDCFEMI